LNGRAPHTGEIFRNSRTRLISQQIASHGRKAFYEGPIAKRILDCSTAHGGIMIADDLLKILQPMGRTISTTYMTGRFTNCPPKWTRHWRSPDADLMENFPLAGSHELDPPTIQ